MGDDRFRDAPEELVLGGARRGGKTAEQVARFRAIVEAGGTVHVHPRTWLQLLENAALQGLELGGLGVRVSSRFPEGALYAVDPAQDPSVGESWMAGALSRDRELQRELLAAVKRTETEELEELQRRYPL